MRYAHLFALILLFGLPFMALSQQSGVDAALQKGDAKGLGVHFAKSIDLSFPGTEDSFTSDKAVTALSDFFSQQVVKGYKKLHLNTPQEGRSNYEIGDLYTGNGTYRITLFYDAQKKISEIEIKK